MKIRHKPSGVELDITNPDVVHGDRPDFYYETLGGSLIAHHDPNWEVVPESTWEDVTSACMIHVAQTSFGHGAILHCIGFAIIDVLSAEHNKDYRIRLVNGNRHMVVERRTS